MLTFTLNCLPQILSKKYEAMKIKMGHSRFKVWEDLILVIVTN